MCVAALHVFGLRDGVLMSLRRQIKHKEHIQGISSLSDTCPPGNKFLLCIPVILVDTPYSQVPLSKNIVPNLHSLQRSRSNGMGLVCLDF